MSRSIEAVEGNVVLETVVIKEQNNKGDGKMGRNVEAVASANGNAVSMDSETKSEEMFPDDREYLTRIGHGSLHDGAEKIVRRYSQIMDMCSPRSRFTEREFILICARSCGWAWDYELPYLKNSLVYGVEDFIAIEHSDKEYGVEDAVALVEKLKQLTPIEAVALMNLVEDWFESNECGEVAKVARADEPRPKANSRLGKALMKFTTKAKGN